MISQKALSKFRYRILHYLISIIKIWNNQSVNTNFLLVACATLNFKSKIANENKS